MLDNVLNVNLEALVRQLQKAKVAAFNQNRHNLTHMMIIYERGSTPLRFALVRS